VAAEKALEVHLAAEQGTVDVQDELDADYMLVTCPDGVSAGQSILVTTPDGRDLEIEVPEGIEAGDGFEVFIGATEEAGTSVDGSPEQSMEAESSLAGQLGLQQVAVVCPEGVAPGMVLEVLVGEVMIEVEIPEGVGPGDEWVVEVDLGVPTVDGIESVVAKGSQAEVEVVEVAGGAARSADEEATTRVLGVAVEVQVEPRIGVATCEEGAAVGAAELHRMTSTQDLGEVLGGPEEWTAEEIAELTRVGEIETGTFGVQEWELLVAAWETMVAEWQSVVISARVNGGKTATVVQETPPVAVALTVAADMQPLASPRLDVPRRPRWLKRPQTPDEVFAATLRKPHRLYHARGAVASPDSNSTPRPARIVAHNIGDTGCTSDWQTRLTDPELKGNRALRQTGRGRAGAKPAVALADVVGRGRQKSAPTKPMPVEAAPPEWMQRMTDPAQYTGAHKARFKRQAKSGRVSTSGSRRLHGSTRSQPTFAPDGW
jgi:hypothetical protein